jgi:NADH:ubiquinone oxidoreductase subunit E
MAYKNYILVCAGTACESNKGKALYEALEKEIKAAGVDTEVQLVKTGCFGFCEQGPIVKSRPQRRSRDHHRAHRQGPQGRTSSL